MTRERAYSVRGIVLRGRNLGEADRIYTLLTEGYGKVDAIAKGVRRLKSHFSGRLEFMTVADFTLHRGRNLDIITGAEIFESSWDLVVEPSAFGMAQTVAELVDALCEPDLPLQEVYLLVRGTLEALRRSIPAELLLPRFEMRLLAVLGLAPPTDHCIRCGRELGDAGAWVDSVSGGLACARCEGSLSAMPLRLSAADLANFRAVAAERGATPPPTYHAGGPTARAIEAIVHAHLGRKMKSKSANEELATR